jgi:hypothetical protein
MVFTAIYSQRLFFSSLIGRYSSLSDILGKLFYFTISSKDPDHYLNKDEENSLEEGEDERLR